MSAIQERSLRNEVAPPSAQAIAARRCSCTDEPRSHDDMHPSTQVSVSNQTRNSNFEAGTALEHLRAEMIQVEALARAAEAAADALPAPITDRQRLVYGRIQSLATKT